MITLAQKEFLLPKAYNAAIRAGAEILAVYESEAPLDIDLKTDNTPITMADRRSHELIKRYLGQTRIPVLSEEGREMLYTERKDWDLFWLVDPLDGTKEFIKGNGEFTVNIALMVDNKPLFGVIYVPYIRKIYFSDPDLGAFRKEGVVADPEAEFCYGEMLADVEKLPVTEACNKPLRIAISRSHNTEETFTHINEFKLKHPDAVVQEQGSSYKFCLIAEGSFDYYIRTTGTYEWDTAAGEAILAAAGGRTLSHPAREEFAYNKESLLNPNFTCESSHLVKM